MSNDLEMSTNLKFIEAEIQENVGIRKNDEERSRFIQKRNNIKSKKSNKDPSEDKT